MAKNQTQTLEDFIKKYTGAGAKSYSDWLSSVGDTAEQAYAYAQNEANKEYERALSSYGALGEKTAKSGLGGSGYAAYLDANAYSEMQRAKQNALTTKNTQDAQNRIKYSDYLGDYENEREKNLQGIIKSISGYGTDEDAAYQYALYSGLPEELAKGASQLGINLAKGKKASGTLTQRQKASVMNMLIGKGYSRGNLYYFLTAMGLSQDEANSMADTIYKISGEKKPSSWDKLLEEQDGVK